MTEVYALYCASLREDDQLNATLPRLSNDRQARVHRLQGSEKRAQCAAAGLLLNYLFGKDGQPPRLTHGSRGKPYLFDTPNTYFSLSHTGNWVFCAVADSEVGLDAQTQVACNNKIAKRWFTPTEIIWLAANPDERFSLLWARKEAYCKFTGFGLVLPPSSFTVPCPADGQDENNHCCWKEYTFHTDHTPIHIAVCCADKTDFSQINIIDINETYR